MVEHHCMDRPKYYRFIRRQTITSTNILRRNLNRTGPKIPNHYIYCTPHTVPNFIIHILKFSWLLHIEF